MALNMYIVLAKEVTTYFVKSEERGIAPLIMIVLPGKENESELIKCKGFSLHRNLGVYCCVIISVGDRRTGNFVLNGTKLLLE